MSDSSEGSPGTTEIDPESLSADDIADLARALKSANEAVRTLRSPGEANERMNTATTAREASRNLRRVARTIQAPALATQIAAVAETLEGAESAGDDVSRVTDQLEAVAEVVQDADVPVYVDAEGGLRPRLSRIRKSGGSPES